MREYIFEKVKNTTRHFKFGDINVYQRDPLPDGFDGQRIFRSIEEYIPSKFFKGLKGVEIGHQDFFDVRKANASYRDGILYISNEQDDVNDLLDDIVHEFAHHVEMLYPEEVYKDEIIKKEFLKKRHQLQFELRSEGYRTTDYNFDNLKYDKKFDEFLYDRVGGTMLKMVTTGNFIRPYAAVSLREYFATGFEEYFLGNQEKLKETSPQLFKKLDQLVKD